MTSAYSLSNPSSVLTPALFTGCLLFLASMTAFPREMQSQPNPRVIISTDIGGTDPDDFQSMIHYLMYADRFDTEGLVSSPYGPGRKSDIIQIIELYEKDYPTLKAHADGFPFADKLRAVVRQGATEQAPANGWSAPTEGSQWIVDRARTEDKRPLWILVWGGLEDLAQALHDAPDIEPALRVYWIGGPNKKWSVNSYLYLVRNFPDLWMIEANSTYRGWFLDSARKDDFSNNQFFEKHINGAGALGNNFVNYYNGEIKMGDTPSVAYLLHGDPDNPAGESWGGSFDPLSYSVVQRFERNTTLNDEIPTYSVIEWLFDGPNVSLDINDPCFRIEIDGQRFDGYYQGNGKYLARFVPKKAGRWRYRIMSKIKELEKHEGAFASVDPWPGEKSENHIGTLSHWWSDREDPELFQSSWQGAQTIAKWREDYLSDWAERCLWLK